MTLQGQDVWQIGVGEAGQQVNVVGALPARQGRMTFPVPATTLSARGYEGQSVQFAVVRLCANC